jgi:uncharacterized protein involved in exopolysaccharide biosynthesis
MESSMIMQPTAKDLITVLFRRKKTFFGVAGGVMLLGAAYLILVTPQYRSEASIVVRFDEKAIPTTNMAHDTTPEVTAQNDRRETVVANSEIIASPDLARGVIESFGLDNIYPDIQESPPRLGTPLDEAVRVFAKDLNVEPGQQGTVIQLSFQHRSPAMAKEALERLIAAYMKREGEIFSSSDVEFQQQQMEQAKARLVVNQAALQAFKTGAGISSFDDQIVALIKQRSDVAGSLQNAQVSLGQSKVRRDQLEALLTKVSPNVQNSASGEKYHALDDAESRVADLRVKERQMLATYNGSSPMLDQLRASLATAQADVQRNRGSIASRDSNAPNVVYQNIQTDLLRSTAETRAYTDAVTVLQGQLAAMDRALQDSEAQRTKLNDLTRAVQIDDSAYRALALHLEDARVVQNRVLDRLSHGAVITNPSLPYKAAKPRYVITAIATVFAGLLAGIMAAIFLELIDDRFTGIHQIEQRLGIPVLAAFGEKTW